MISKELPLWRSSMPFTKRTAVRMSLLTCIKLIVGSILSDAALSCDITLQLLSLTPQVLLLLICSKTQEAIVQKGCMPAKTI